MPHLTSSEPMNETARNVREQEMLTTLFELGREVTSVLDLDELLRRSRS